MTVVPHLAEILLIHELLIETFGGMRGVTEQGFGKLESALATPEHSMFGVDLYPDPPAKAAAFFYSLIRAHGFSDGNKRVALVALIDLLLQNGWQLACDQQQLYDLTLAAADHLDRVAIENWLRSNVTWS
ncbi:MAG: type II toxin-antitoxin system death-on-curing family toxin [Herpetosiphon sp.]